MSTAHPHLRRWLPVAAIGLGAMAVGLTRVWPDGQGRAALADFRRRYRRALADPNLGRNLLAFQRAWRPARAAAFAVLADLASAQQAQHDGPRGERAAPTLDSGVLDG